MNRIKLDQKTVDRMRAPDPSGKQTMYWDSSKAGFGVRVSGSKNSIAYIVQRTLPNKKDRRVTIGRTSELSLEQARREADELILSMRSGVDPKAGKKGEVTLKQAADGYLAARPNLSERSKRDYARVFDSYLADWRDVKLSAITREMVERRHLLLGEQRGKATANGVMRTARAIFNWAIDRYPGIGGNPVRLSRQWFSVPRRDRYIRADELPKFYRAVLALDNAVARDFVLLLLLTGLRRAEAASLTWQDVDFAARAVRLPALRTKAKRKLDLPMSTHVLKLLKARRALGDATFVFPGRQRGHFVEPKKTFKQIAEATGIAVSSHDLRRTYAQAAITAGVHTLALKGLLNHGVSEGGDVTLGYINLSTEDLREPAQRVANQLAAWCKMK
jgi:integrase